MLKTGQCFFLNEDGVLMVAESFINEATGVVETINRIATDDD